MCGEGVDQGAVVKGLSIEVRTTLSSPDITLLPVLLISKCCTPKSPLVHTHLQAAAILTCLQVHIVP